jgi:hypothetical protein
MYAAVKKGVSKRRRRLFYEPLKCKEAKRGESTSWQIFNSSCEFRMWPESATADLDRLKPTHEDTLKTVLAAPAACTNSAGNSSASPRRNIPARSGRSICACSILGKGGVWISRPCFGSFSSSILACGNKGRYAEHDQSCCQPRFFSHKDHSRTDRSCKPRFW